jgi:hypothetical protein
VRLLAQERAPEIMPYSARAATERRFNGSRNFPHILDIMKRGADESVGRR